MNKKNFSVMALLALSVCGTSYAAKVEMPEKVAEALVENAVVDEAILRENVKKGLQKAQARATVDYLIDHQELIQPAMVSA